MINVSSIYRMQNILYSVYFAKDTEDWCGYSKFNFLCHISASCLSLNNGRKTVT